MTEIDSSVADVDTTVTQRSIASLAMDRYAVGEEGAFAVVYDELCSPLIRYLTRLVRDQAVAEDLLQQTFLNMHRARGRFTAGARVEPWAYAIAHSCALSWIRREASRKTGTGASDEDASVDASAENDLRASELWTRMARELDRVSPKLRESFLLVRLEGLTHAEAAHVLGIPESTVKLRAHRATLRLRMRFSRSKGDVG